jgi:hypothetical protein
MGVMVKRKKQVYQHQTDGNGLGLSGVAISYITYVIDIDMDYLYGFYCKPNYNAVTVFSPEIKGQAKLGGLCQTTVSYHYPSSETHLVVPVTVYKTYPCCGVYAGLSASPSLLISIAPTDSGPRGDGTANCLQSSSIFALGGAVLNGTVRTSQIVRFVASGGGRFGATALVECVYKDKNKDKDK